MAESQNHLVTANNRKEALKALMQKEAELNVALEEKFLKFKQYQERELMLWMNNHKLQTQLQNLSKCNNSMINEIAEKNSNCDKLRQQIDYDEARNAKESNEAGDKLDAKIAYYRNAMVGAFDEYKVQNLEGDQKVYEMKVSDDFGIIHNYEKSIEELIQEFGKFSASEKIEEVQRIINMLSEEDEEIVRYMRSVEEEGANSSRQNKQLKFEVTGLKKKLKNWGKN